MLSGLAVWRDIMQFSPYICFDLQGVGFSFCFRRAIRFFSRYLSMMIVFSFSLKINSSKTKGIPFHSCSYFRRGNISEISSP